MKPQYVLLVAIPLALGGHLLEVEPLLVFVISIVALAPLSELLADAGEDLAVHAGPRFGGLITTFSGNTPELVIGVLALQAGLLRLVKASITGAILANLLLVLGLGLFVGGLRNGRQYFNREHAALSATLMVISLIALLVPALYWALVPDPDTAMRNAGEVETLSEAVAALMLLVYALSVYFSLFWDQEGQIVAGVHHLQARRSLRRASGLMIGALVAFTMVAAVFVASVPQVTARWAISDYFIGIVVVPLIGSLSSHLVGIESAFRNRADLTLSVTTGASIHVVLFVAPTLVFLSLLLGHPMDLIFSELELVGLAAASGVSTLVAQDGMSNWLEGAMLVAVYAILALAFYWVPL
jgi:Ca2+:H+ antiporter